MTGLLHEKEFSRKSFVKGGGALIVGFSLAGSAFAGKAAAKFPATPPTAAGFNPDLNQVDSWITINADETIVLKTSQIETGNGITTGFLQVLAEELDADMSQMRYGMFNTNSHDVVDTWVAGSTGGEGGSNAMSGTGPKIRNVGALAYGALLSMASTKLGVPVANLTVKSGTVTGGGKSVTYGQLVGDKTFNLTGANNALASALQSRSKSRSGFSMGASLAFFRPSANLRARTSSFVLSASMDARNFASTESVCSRSRRAVSSKSIEGARSGGVCARTTPSVRSMVSLDSQHGQSTSKVSEAGFFAMAVLYAQTTGRAKAPPAIRRRAF